MVTYPSISNDFISNWPLICKILLPFLIVLLLSPWCFIAQIKAVIAFNVFRVFLSFLEGLNKNVSFFAKVFFISLIPSVESSFFFMLILILLLFLLDQLFLQILLAIFLFRFISVLFLLIFAWIFLISSFIFFCVCIVAQFLFLFSVFYQFQTFYIKEKKTCC